jgi:hypothetical protein
MTKLIGTNFTSAEQTTKINKPGTLSIHELSSIEQISPAGERLAKNSPPRDAYEVSGSPGSSAPSASTGGAPVGQVMKRGDTMEGIGSGSNFTPDLPLMTDLGKRLATKTAPQSGFKVGGR